MPRVMINPATYENVRESVEKAFELFPLRIQGKRVLIKPNVLRATEAKEGVVTHPAVLRAVVRKVESLEPAHIVVGDNPGLFSYGANEGSFKKTGLMEAAMGYYENIGNVSEKVDFNPDFMPAVSISRAVLDAEIIISLPDFKLPPLGGEALSGNKAAQELIYSRTILRPKADPELCTACGTCVDQCAVSALSMGDDNLPQVDADTCITCFCCQEICPEKALTLQ
jgi:Pyruvate/2-oxoacid:ferredoxin oxidoreductase delta subunit